MRVTDETSGATSWVALKDQGRVAFERGDYEMALSKYGAALQPEKECPAPEQQLILSNIVAARLKLGGPAQAEAAVAAAKKVRRIEEHWVIPEKSDGDALFGVLHCLHSTHQISP